MNNTFQNEVLCHPAILISLLSQVEVEFSFLSAGKQRALSDNGAFCCQIIASKVNKEQCAGSKQKKNNRKITSKSLRIGLIILHKVLLQIMPIIAI